MFCNFFFVLFGYYEKSTYLCSDSKPSKLKEL